jgi:hypothetical protein
LTTFAFTTGNPSNLTAGATASMNDIQGPLVDLRTFVNGSVDGDNLSTTVGQQLGLSSSSITRRGKSLISATGTRTNIVYGALSNGPDQVSVVLPTDGILAIAFRAYWLSSVANAGRAAIFLGANQLKHPQGDVAAGQLDEATTVGTNFYQWLTADGHGLIGTDGVTFGAEGTDAVTTGLVIGMVNAAGTLFGGGPLLVEAAAGTYTVSVQFKSSSGSVTVGGRKLWAWTIGF